MLLWNRNRFRFINFTLKDHLFWKTWYAAQAEYKKLNSVVYKSLHWLWTQILYTQVAVKLMIFYLTLYIKQWKIIFELFGTLVKNFILVIWSGWSPTPWRLDNVFGFMQFGCICSPSTIPHYYNMHGPPDITCISNCTKNCNYFWSLSLVDFPLNINFNNVWSFML